MIESIPALFKYLKGENININQEEFKFQAQSHPDYPSLLTISDTLLFFNIDNGAMRINFSDIESLPNRFIALLKEEQNQSKFYYIEKKNEEIYRITRDNKLSVISKKELENQWDSLVLLVENQQNNFKSNKKTWFTTLFFLSLVSFFYTVLQFQIDLLDKTFFIFPILGVFFSIAALKDLFGTKSELLNRFCNLTVSSSCTSVVGSDKWKIFEKVNFSDLSIIFFTSQFLGLILFIFMADVEAYFNIQKIMLVCAIPIILISIYYQKFVEKKWCPICLAIIGIILFELFYLLFIKNIILNISVSEFCVFSFVLVTVVFLWDKLKGLLTLQKELKEFKIKANRFMNNYEIFKNTLVATEKMELAFSPIILGNKESDLEIAIITSPFCGYCKDAHKILEKILLSYKDDLKIKILINADIKNLNDEKKIFFRILMTIYIDRGEDLFLEALHDWFKNKNLTDWIKKYKLDYDEEKIDLLYDFQNQWCISNNLYFTPAIYINEYPYPRTYERESLNFFVGELIDDESFCNR
ncbi:vitamin K epoxide reductase family protein [Flavobacterium daejeonense]|uniref:vitamin K epoxide reductase family protein n=1 Tax=Flavobacterium daejeonense TaxID=350893 RepID=UPI00047EBC69|nr:vitamin K epoxide reductase family protein [Flavobacterium daejeonense]